MDTGAVPGTYNITAAITFANGSTAATTAIITVTKTPTFQLFYSRFTDHRNPRPLDGAQNLTGNIYVFLLPNAWGIQNVTFGLNGIFFHVETIPYYDFNGMTHSYLIVKPQT
jgi:hypothetical protein